MVEIRDARQQKFDRGALFEIHLATMSDTELGDTPPIWWEMYIPHHRLACELPSGRCVVRSGNLTLGSAMETSSDMPVILHSDDECRRVRFTVPWTGLPLLTAAAGKHLAINAAIFSAGFGQTPSYMKWVPNHAFGVLRLEG